MDTPQKTPLQSEIEALKASARDALSHPLLPKAAGDAVRRLVGVVEALAVEQANLRAELMNARRDAVLVGASGFPPIAFPAGSQVGG